MTFGKALRFCRINRNMTQRELGELANTSQGTIANIESNKYRPSIRMFERLSAGLEIPEFFLSFLAERKENMDISAELHADISKEIEQRLATLKNRIPE